MSCRDVHRKPRSFSLHVKEAGSGLLLQNESQVSSRYSGSVRKHGKLLSLCHRRLDEPQGLVATAQGYNVVPCCGLPKIEQGLASIQRNDQSMLTC